MKRRVIFPDPDIWTQRKATMTDHADNPRAADARRASALTIHHRRRNPAGATEIIRETCTAKRSTELVLALLAIHQTAIVQLRTDAALGFVGRYVQQLANGAAEHADDERAGDITRCAALLDAHGRGDTEAINRAMREAVDAGRPTQLIGELLDLYEVLLPELSSEPGIAWLGKCVGTFATEEAEGDL